MALNDVKSLSAEIERNNLEEVILGLARSVNPYVSIPLSKDADLNEVFNAFPEGNRILEPRNFFVQKRLNPGGRVGIRYAFRSIDSSAGLIGFSVFDNGENIPQNYFDEVYSALRTYVVDKGLMITEEILKPEY